MKLLVDMNLPPRWVEFWPRTGLKPHIGPPSVSVLPESIGADVVRVLRTHATALEAGAIVTIDELGARVRVLPIQSTQLRR